MPPASPTCCKAVLTKKALIDHLNAHFSPRLAKYFDREPRNAACCDEALRDKGNSTREIAVGNDVLMFTIR